MSETVLVKLGGSLITDKRRPWTLRRKVLVRLAEEVARARPRMSEALILSHGSGSFGHRAAAAFDLHRGVGSRDGLVGVGVTQDAAARLHRRVVESLIAAKVEVYSLAPSSFMVASGGRLSARTLDPLILALEQGLVPVTFGDVVLDRRRGASIGSTEAVLHCIARRLLRRGFDVKRMLWLGETDGVYDEAGRTIPLISKDNLRAVLGAVGGAAGVDVTGGMRHRIETAWAMTRLGIRSSILNGREPGILERALRGQAVPGTEVAVDP